MKSSRLIWLAGALTSLFLVVPSCSSGDDDDLGGGGGGNTDPTPLQVQVEVSRSTAFSAGEYYTSIEYYASIAYDGVPVNTATVSVNGVNVPRVVGFIDGYYDLREYESPVPSYVPNQTYTVVVTYGGNTYTESQKAPGGFTTNADYSNIQWVENGKYGGIAVAYLFGSDTYSRPPSSPAALSSPQAIPNAAYPGPGTYTLHVWQQNIKEDAFGTLRGDECYLIVEDFREWRVTKG